MIKKIHTWSDEEEITDTVNALVDAVTKLTKEEPQEEWPKDGDEYWYIGSEGIVYRTLYVSGSLFDYKNKDFGNCFKTKEEAESARDKVRDLLKSLQK